MTQPSSPRPARRPGQLPLHHLTHVTCPTGIMEGIKTSVGLHSNAELLRCNYLEGHKKPKMPTWAGFSIYGSTSFRTQTVDLSLVKPDFGESA
jgi:hypothetical protein